MIQTVVKSLRVFVFGIIPLFLIASVSKDHESGKTLEKGTYECEASGAINGKVNGFAFFKIVKQHHDSGQISQRLELSFKTEEIGKNALIQFELTNKPDSKGVYKIKNLERLFHGLEGVYGYADLGKQNELPFFASRGSITILENGSDILVGNLEVGFKNANNETLNLKGFFNAK
ncbi:hypothetical protein ACNR9Q_04310 [Maribacter sp. X9]|uniref:hypothetical protein n=1 Tax=Maribacter sp. X9 TaxID=3402159 RepID=UPI003AF404D9